MLSNTLNTNEIKNAAGTGLSFTRKNEFEFQLTDEVPALKHRLLIGHQESGSGIFLRRRSRFRFNKTVVASVDNVTPVIISFVGMLEVPIGALLANTEVKNVIAEGTSFLASLGASTTILYDCTGNGARVLLNGES